MSYFVKVIPPSKRARIHRGDCRYCRDGQGMLNHDKGTGPTYWHPAFPKPGFESPAQAKTFMASLGPRYDDTGSCQYCMRGEA